MSDLCTERFRELAATLGGIPCEGTSPVGYVRDPRDLADPTMPFVEIVFVGLAALTLAHAIASLRRGNAVRLGVWLAAVVYVLVLEPPLYFPKAFGLEDYVPAIFVHNRFTVGFLFDRLPLYILSLYPGMVYLAWMLVERFRLPARYAGWRLAVVTALCVGTVHHVFYEIFDMLGPQRLWWAWDYELPLTEQRIGSVPVSSMVNFALVMPAAFALLCVLVLGRRPRTDARSVLLPALVIGALTPVVSMPGQLPISLLDAVEDFPVALSMTLVTVLGALALGVTVREAVLVLRSETPHEDDGSRTWVLAVGSAYLLAFAALWAIALPQTLDAVDGRVPSGQLVGSLPYVAGCFTACIGVLFVAGRRPLARVTATPVHQSQALARG